MAAKINAFMRLLARFLYRHTSELANITSPGGLPQGRPVHHDRPGTAAPPGAPGGRRTSVPELRRTLRCAHMSRSGTRPARPDLALCRPVDRTPRMLNDVPVTDCPCSTSDL